MASAAELKKKLADAQFTIKSADEKLKKLRNDLRNYSGAKSLTPAQNEAAGVAATGVSKDGTSITEQESVITKANAKNIINKVFEDQLGRSATDAEIAKYTATFKEKAAAQPTITTTTTAGKKTKISTKPGFTTGRAEQYLVDKIAGTDEAKAGQVLDYYQSFMRKLGL